MNRFLCDGNTGFNLVSDEDSKNGDTEVLFCNSKKISSIC